ncbi:MAG: hypothetical protein KJ887_01950 [Candidatus Omnitrophica bacterium]|nr:hypothetical protein [Candidatus Omnitrophota bacterium]MBU1047831.1 hypothetical protein [Candidatus Omnitrophota bacterium]MBU1630568.1 hypothetical protein [Candidatus Omnitrophota bacterium]MBU1888453.1 hypothetical protein [Candidatus Omnitrophota bacterium]
MKTDIYTKVVLTIIALCLVWLCLKPISVDVEKVRGIERIWIGGVTDVRIKN